MLFPVRGLHALPFKAPSADESLFDDLSAMHAERLGVRADPMAGQLTDTFVVTQTEEGAILLCVVLKSPGDGDLPPRGPKEFDLSARAFPVSGDAVAVWKEFERWVFAFYRQGRLLYSQATSSGADAPDVACLREIHLAMAQLSLQGLSIQPDKVLVWSPDGSGGDAGSLAEGLGVPAQVSARPDPVLPEPRSKLLPADVRAARRVQRSRQQRLAIAGACLLVYLGVAGWKGYGLWSKHRQIQDFEAQAEEIAPKSERDAYEEHKQLWSELELVVDLGKSPVELMSRIARAIPPNSGLRLKTAEISPGQIKLDGEATQAAPVSQFSVNLTRESYGLSDYQWDNAPPTNSSKGWTFQATGSQPDSEAP